MRQPSFLLGGISLGLGGALGGGLGGGEQDELARALAMSLGENVMVSTDPTSETNDGRSREDQVHSFYHYDPFKIESSLFDAAFTVVNKIKCKF